MAAGWLTYAKVLTASLALALSLPAVMAHADVDEIVLVREPGLTSFALTVMDNKRMLEARLQAAGLPGVKVRHVPIGATSSMVDMLLSGRAHVIQSGAPGLLTLWSKTKDRGQVVGLAAGSRMAYWLVSRNPAVKTISDLSDADKVALPSVKISAQALVLQMAAEQAFGPGQHERLDKLTVTMPSPEAMASLVYGKTEINAHFASAPFNLEESKSPGARVILNSYDVLGGESTGGIISVTRGFAQDNPKVTAALLAAIGDAMALINADKDAAAKLYLEITNEKVPLDRVKESISQVGYNMTPANVMKYADFMQRTGRIAKKPTSIDQLFLPGPHMQGAN